jgi:hypothetical protein
MSFTSDDNPTTDAPTQANADQAFLEVGDRKFSSPDEVVTKITNQDQFIETLKQERDQDRSLLNDLLEQMTALKNNSVDQSTFEQLLERKQQQQDPEPEKGVSVPTSDDITERVMQELTARQQQEAQATNLQNAMAKAKNTFGEGYKDAVLNTAQSLGLTGADVDEMAESKPKLFESLFLKQAAPTKPATRSTVFLDPKDTGGQVKFKSWSEMSSSERNESILQRAQMIQGAK